MKILKNKNVIITILMIVAFCLILMGITGCSNNDKCNEGTITGKMYKKAHTTFRRTGKITIPIRHPERYLIELNQNCTFEVDKETFDKLEVGDEIKNETGGCLNETN